MTPDQALQALQAALSAVPLAAGRCYPVHLPQTTVYPALRWQVVSSVADVTICGSDDAGDTVRVQVDCFAHEYGAVRTLRAQAIAAVQAVTTMTIHRETDRELPFDGDGCSHRIAIDFLISLSNT